MFELAERMTERFDVFVLAPHAPGAEPFEEMGGIKVFRFRYFFSRWQKLAYNGGIIANLKSRKWRYLLVPFFVLAELISLVRLIRMHEIDVIHAHWIIPQGIVAITARAFVPRGKRPAILCTSHGGDLFGLQGFLFSWVKRQVMRRVDKLTVVSGAMRDRAFALSGRQDIEVVPMGVDLVRKFSPRQDVVRNHHEILFVGRLVEKKGVIYLVQAMQEILRHCTEAKLLIAGDGPDRAHLQELARTTGVDRHIQFLGNMDNASLPDLYRRATVFVAPSIVARGGDQEGLGLVFVEALGCECPVVTTDLPAIRDVVHDGLTGLVCEQMSPRDIARNILFLFEHPDLARSQAQAGRVHVLEYFDWQIVARRYGELIEAIS